MSKLDPTFKEMVISGVNALALEVERLEGILERIGKQLDPYYCGGDVEWLLKNQLENLHKMAGIKK